MDLFIYAPCGLRLRFRLAIDFVTILLSGTAASTDGSIEGAVEGVEIIGEIDGLTHVDNGRMQDAELLRLIGIVKEADTPFPSVTVYAKCMAT